MWRQTEAATHSANLDLPYHDIKVPFLVFWPAPDMCSVDEHGYGMRSCGVVLDWLRPCDLFCDTAQSIPHGGVVLRCTGQEGLQDPGRLPEGMPCAQLCLKRQKLLGRATRKELRKRRNRTARSLFTRTCAKPWNPDPKPPEERIEHLRPIVVKASGAAAVATATVRLRDIFDLSVQHRFLKLPEYVFRILQFEPHIAVTLGGETETAKLKCMLVSLISDRFNDDPNIHGRPLNSVNPDTLAEDPQVLPTPRFARVIEGVRRHCPGMIVQVSTGGRSGQGIERGGMLHLRPDMASLSVGSINFPNRVYENAPELFHWLASEMRTHSVMPEIEVFDLSHLLTAIAMFGDGLLGPKLYVQFVLGVQNAMPADRQVLELLVGLLRQRVPDAEWCAAGIGRHQRDVNLWSAEAGAHLRTGLEDNVRLSRDVLAPSNAALVRIAVEAAERSNRPIATVAEARRMLSLSDMAISVA